MTELLVGAGSGSSEPFYSFTVLGLDCWGTHKVHIISSFSPAVKPACPSFPWTSLPSCTPIKLACPPCLSSHQKLPSSALLNISMFSHILCYKLFSRLYTTSIARLPVLGEGSLVCCSPWGFSNFSLLRVSLGVFPQSMWGSKGRGCCYAV